MRAAELKLKQGERWAFVRLDGAQLPEPPKITMQIMRDVANFTYWGRWQSGPNHLKKPALTFGTRSVQNIHCFWAYSKARSMISFIELPGKASMNDKLGYSDYGKGWEQQDVVVLELWNINIVPGGLALTDQTEPMGFVNKGGALFEKGRLTWGHDSSNHKYEK